MLLVVQTYTDDSSWSNLRPPGVHFIQNGKFREILASNHFYFTSLSLFTLVKRPEHQTPTLAKRPELLTSSMVLRPELLLLTLVTGPELTALLQTGVGTLDSGPVLYGTQSSDPYLKQDSQFRSSDRGPGQ